MELYRTMSSQALPLHKFAAGVLWEGAGLTPEPLSRLVLSENPDPSIDSSFKLGTAAQVRCQPDFLGVEFDIGETDMRVDIYWAFRIICCLFS